MNQALLDEPMADKKSSTLSVKLRMEVIESARVVAALRGVTITDLISDMVEDDLKRMEQEEIDKRAKPARIEPARSEPPAPPRRGPGRPKGGKGGAR